VNLLTWRSSYTRPEMWPALAAVALMVMEGMVILLWYQGLFGQLPVSFGFLFTVLMAVQLLSYLITRGMEALHWHMAARRIIFLLWLVTAVFASLKLIIYPHSTMTLMELVSLPVRYILLPDIEGRGFYHLLIVILLVGRGVSLAATPPGLRSIQVSFQLWLMLLLIYGIAFAPLHPVEASIGLYTFLFFGLISMSAARISGLSEMRGAKIPRFGGGWLISMLVAGLAVVGAAVAAGWLASSQVVAIIIRVIITVFTLLAALIVWIFTPLIAFLARLLPGIIESIRGLARSLGNLRLPQFFEDITIQLGQVIEKAIPLVLAGRIVLLVAVVALITLSILLGLRMRKRQALEAEEDANMAEAASGSSTWSKWLQQLFPDGLNLRLRSPAKMLAAARIRRIYRQLMKLSQKMGAERPPSSTPIEFLPRLESLLPEQQASLERITAAYVKVRYGEYPETMQEVDAVEAAWESVRRQGNKKLALQKRQRQTD
jgi:hypothetical protein